jgi:uncharacterized protein
MQNVMQRLQGLDWPGLRVSIQEKGYALTPEVLTAKQCRGLVELYGRDQGFRSHIVMQRYRFGRGEYKYFDYPLPPVVQEIRETCFPHLAPVANRWNEQLGAEERFPETHEAFLKSCRKQGQTRATPLLLHYEAGGFNCLHQDIYGELAFPLQMTCFLSQAGEDYEGGEFVLLEQQPRAQSKAEVIVARQGQMVIFTTRYRAVKGKHGFYRVNVRHGVSLVRSGTRYTLGVIFHDAK